MDIAKLKEIRKLVLISMFADDDLLELFVLKGGSAIELAYKIDARSSIDVDLSIENDISEDNLKTVETKIHASLDKVFNSEGYIVFDFNFDHRPKRLHDGFPESWGGYNVTFKIISEDKGHILETNIDLARKMAEGIDLNDKRTFKIEISKYEYTRNKSEKNIDGYTIYVYTPEMIVIEKLRALCQRMNDYQFHMSGKPPRTKDIYDIYVITEKLNVSILDHMDLIRDVFELKKVPIKLLGNIKGLYEHYLQGLPTLQATIPGGIDERKFQLCFEHVVSLAEQIIEQDQLKRAN